MGLLLLFLLAGGALLIAKNKTKINKKVTLNAKPVELNNITLSDEQQQVYSLLENSNDHFFITGKAGTGKSLLLQYFRENTQKKRVVVAPTGVAAINVRGQTIHSLFRIPPGFINIDSLQLDDKTAGFLRQLDTVVIDEISMVRADLMDAIDFLLKKARKNDQPFGGVQMILFGDLYQLPPVVSDAELHKYFADNHGGFYFFNAAVWQDAPLTTIELSHIFRQKDGAFKDILNSIREGQVTEAMLETLNQRSLIAAPTVGTVTLSTTNKSVNEINETKLSQLPEKIYEFTAEISGKLEQSSFPTEEVLRLKKGAQIMMLKNDKEKRWVNGSLGIIQEISDKEIKVNIDGYIYSVSPETWNKIRHTYNKEKQKVEEEVVSSFTQYPLRLAWAITIHKSQGQTIQSVKIDMGGGAFAHGQTYVALSRATTLERVYLTRPLAKQDIFVDQAVVSFMRKALTVSH